MTVPLITMKNVTKHFPVKRGFFRRTIGYIRAVDGFDCTVHTREVVGVVGESGSGKSTVGRLVLRLLEPTSGTLSWQGVDLSSLHGQQLRAWRKEVQMVFQEPASSLNPRYPILDNIGDALLHHHIVLDEQEKQEAVATILKQVGLPPEMMMRYPHELSGGQQQRVCIGRAISLQSKLIVCDEVVSSLDVSIQAQILHLLMELQETLQLSLLFISHDLSVVKYLCDRVIVMYLGKVMESGGAEEVFRHPRHPYTQALLEAEPRLMPSKEAKHRTILRGEMPSPRQPPSGCPFRTRCPYAQPACAVPPPRRFVNCEQNHFYDCILQ